jgi:hypothetical protein
MNQEYKIATIADFLKVPEEKQEQCLRDFFAWLTLARQAKELEQSLAGGILEGTTLGLDSFLWIDDGKDGLSAVSVSSNGKALGRINLV